jgi:hypothetical protein
MPLFWIVSEADEGRNVFIQESGDLLNARLKASMAGLDGKFVEAHELQPKMATVVPKKMIGRVLTLDEAARLLEKMPK